MYQNQNSIHALISLFRSIFGLTPNTDKNKINYGYNKFKIPFSKPSIILQIKSDAIIKSTFYKSSRQAR